MIDGFKEIDVARNDVMGDVYLLVDGGEITYIGQTTCLQSRLELHRKSKRFDRAFSLSAPIAELRAYEGALIRRFNPRDVGGGAIGDRSRDVEILTRLGLEPDASACAAYRARISAGFSVAHRRSAQRNLSHRHYRTKSRRLSRVFFNAAVRVARKLARMEAS